MALHSFRKCPYLFLPCKVLFRQFATKNGSVSSKGHVPLLLAAMPVISFGLGTWQVYRLQWKKSLIQQLEDKTMKEPLEITDRLVYTQQPYYVWWPISFFKIEYFAMGTQRTLEHRGTRVHSEIFVGNIQQGNIMDHHFEMTDYITSGIASPTIQSRCANIAMFINYHLAGCATDYNQHHPPSLPPYITTYIIIVIPIVTNIMVTTIITIIIYDNNQYLHECYHYHSHLHHHWCHHHHYPGP